MIFNTHTHTHSHFHLLVKPATDSAGICTIAGGEDPAEFWANTQMSTADNET